ncbi:MAG: glycosyltransferase [Nocardioidaceae bacterium]
MTAQPQAARPGDVTRRTGLHARRLPEQQRRGTVHLDKVVTSVESARVQATCDITIIVPTRNEVGHIGPLVRRLGAALAGHDARVIFVDDSDDDTPQEVLRVARTSRVDVQLMHRDPEDRDGGLGGAVLAGLRRAGGQWAVVMDGDLQHPPELVPELVAVGVRDQADVVVASRDVPGGSSPAPGHVRGLHPAAPGWLHRAVLPRQVHRLSDPMSGFFAIRVDAFPLDGMRPHGSRVLLQLLAGTGGAVTSEVPFVGGDRPAGEPGPLLLGASLRQGMTFLGQLAKLRLAEIIGEATRTGTAKRGAGLALAGAGILLNLLAMWLLADPSTLGLPYLLAAVLATQLSATWDFLLVDGTHPGPKHVAGRRRWLAFLTASNAGLLLRLPVLVLLVSGLDVGYLLAAGLTLLPGFAWLVVTRGPPTFVEGADRIPPLPSR